MLSLPLTSARDRLREGPTLYAHRGAKLELPENTLGGFRLAVELGADAIETDAHMTRDGRIVLSHDPTGLRMAGVAVAIRDATHREAEAWDMGARFVARDGSRASSACRIPTLDEALAELPGVVFNVDAKQVYPDMIPALLRSIRGAHAEDRVRIASFSTRNLRRARGLGYEGQTGLGAAELAAIMLAPSRLARALRRGDAAQVPPRAWGMTFASQRTIDRLHRLGLRVDFWTIDDPDEARRLLAMGADGIMTDDIRRVRSACRA
jgi:glycerophosphoryl diester phosphodiesterase